MATTEPIRSYDEISQILAVIDCVRDRALFTLGINTAFRGGDLLTLTLGDVAGVTPGSRLRVRESKTGKMREALLNAECVEVLAELVDERRGHGANTDDALFVSHRSHRSMTIVTLSRLWKEWSEKAGLRGVYGSHSGRKTKAYILRRQEGLDIGVISKFLNHSSPAITMRYACIQDHEVEAVGLRSMMTTGA